MKDRTEAPITVSHSAKNESSGLSNVTSKEDGVERGFDIGMLDSPPEPEKRPSIFISYRHGGKTQAIAARLAADLNNVCDVIWDANIIPGDLWPKFIEDKISQV